MSNHSQLTHNYTSNELPRSTCDLHTHMHLYTYTYIYIYICIDILHFASSCHLNSDCCIADTRRQSAVERTASCAIQYTPNNFPIRIEMSRFEHMCRNRP